MASLKLTTVGCYKFPHRATMLSSKSERLEAMAARGEAGFDIDLYGQMCDRLGRVFGRLGLKRVAREIDAGPLSAHFAEPHKRPA